jgi:hypothetical protein
MPVKEESPSRPIPSNAAQVAGFCLSCPAPAGQAAHVEAVLAAAHSRTRNGAIQINSGTGNPEVK